MRELNRTESAGLFRTDGKGWPLLEGKSFHQYIIDYEKPDYTISPEEGLRYTATIKEYRDLNKEIHEVSRLVFRDVAASTNVRGMISCIIPKHTFVTNTAPLVLPRINERLLLDQSYYKIIAYMAGIFNSTCFDFLIRRRISTHLNFFFVEQTPVPSKINSLLGKEITKISARLNCIDNRFIDLASAIGVECGPMSIKERIQLTAELDALIAHHYRLDRMEYEYIINTFPAFKEDASLEKSTDIEWNDLLIRKFNGEVRKRVLSYYDSIKLQEGEIIETRDYR